MNKFVLSTESCCDLTEEYLQQNNVYSTPMMASINDVEYAQYDGVKGVSTIAMTEFYKKLREGGKIKTSQVNIEQATNHLEQFLSQGLDVLQISFSTGVSGTCNSFTAAALELRKKYPNNKIRIVDTLSGSLGQGLLVTESIKMRDNGKTIDEITLFLEETKHNVNHFLVVNDLNYLWKGGRLSMTSAILGTILKIKPVIFVNDEGKLELTQNVISRKKSLIRLVEKIEERIDSTNKTIYVAHCDCLDDAHYVVDLIKERLNLTVNIVNIMGMTMGGHAGPGALAVYFIGKNRKIK